MKLAAWILLTATGLSQTFGGTFAPLAIPDGPGACGTLGAPLVLTITVPPGTGIVSFAALAIDLAHTWYGDVDLVVQSPFGTAVLMLGTASGCGPGSNLSGGRYTLLDPAPRTLDTVANLTAGTASIPTGPYKADNNFSLFNGQNAAGVWTFTFRDRANGDLGSVAGLFLSINTCPLTAYLLTQNGPGQPLVITHLCGQPGDFFLAPAVLGPGGSNPGATPTGWFNGLDIPLATILNEMNFGLPFYGVIPSGGTISITIPGVPPNVAISTCAVHVDPVAGSTSFVATGFTITTI